MSIFSTDAPDEADAASDATDVVGFDADRRSTHLDVTGVVERPGVLRRNRWRLVVAALAVVAAGAAVFLPSPDEDEPGSVVAEPVRSVVAEVRDLTDVVELDGRLVQANLATVAAPADGVITELADEDAQLVRGDTVYAIDATPATLFYADVPLYRPLEEGAVGDDVEMLEANLAALGYHTVETEDGDQTDEGFVVDGEFDSATTDAVERWQAETGAEVTGVVTPAAVAVAPGPLDVEGHLVQLGDRVTTGTPIVEVAEVGTSDSTSVEHSGEIDLLVDTGDVVASGDILYVVGDVPITAVVGTETIERELAVDVDAGDDVRMLEEMLVGLGYDAGGALLVDDRFDEDTARAVENWQEDLANSYEEVVVDGEVDPADVIVLEPDTVVGDLVAHETDVLAAGSLLWSSITPNATHAVETDIEVSDQDRLAVGTTIDVRFPDDEVVSGTVTELARSTTIDPADPDAEATRGVEIEVVGVPDALVELDEVDVVVELVEELDADAVVVPASALVAIGDGEYAVEAVTTTGTRLVPVVPGMFSDGWVGVEGIVAGTQVVVP